MNTKVDGHQHHTKQRLTSTNTAATSLKEAFRIHHPVDGMTAQVGSNVAMTRNVAMACHDGKKKHFWNMESCQHNDSTYLMNTFQQRFCDSKKKLENKTR